MFEGIHGKQILIEIEHNWWTSRVVLAAPLLAPEEVFLPSFTGFLEWPPAIFGARDGNDALIRFGRSPVR